MWEESKVCFSYVDLDGRFSDRIVRPLIMAFYGPVWCSQAGASCEWASRIPTRFGCHRSRRQTNNFFPIRGRPQIISRERMSDRTDMPSDEEIAEVSANTVKVAVP